MHTLTFRTLAFSCDNFSAYAESSSLTVCVDAHACIYILGVCVFVFVQLFAVPVCVCVCVCAAFVEASCMFFPLRAKALSYQKPQRSLGAVYLFIIVNGSDREEGCVCACVRV